MALDTQTSWLLTELSMVMGAGSECTWCQARLGISFADPVAIMLATRRYDGRCGRGTVPRWGEAFGGTSALATGGGL